MRLKELRIKMGLSQLEFAKKISVAQNTLSNWENEKRQPDYDTLMKIAQFFNVSIDYLLGNDISEIITGSTTPALSSEDENLLKLFHTLNEEDKATATGYIEFLTQNAKYKKIKTPHSKDEHDFDNAIDHTDSVEKTRKKV